MRPTPHHVPARTLVIGWCLWLLGAWFVNNTLEGWAVHTPIAALRWTALATVVGIMLVWPAWRLSCRHAQAFTFNTLLDMLLLLGLFQIVAAAIARSYSPLRAVLIDLTVVIWAIPIGMWIDLGRRGDAAVRTLAMFGCMVTFAGGAVAAGHVDGPVAVAVSPLRTLWELMATSAAFTDLALAWAMAAVAAGWVLLWVIARVIVGRTSAR